VPGSVVDQAISNLLLELMQPMTLQVALAVQQEVEARVTETDALRRKHVERAQYEAELARRRYMKVDPLCVLRIYVISKCEMLCWRSSSMVPGTHNYSDLRKAMSPAS
jgi:hypothetical protein